MRNMQQKTHGAVIVTRVSTGEQAKHGTSLESQQDACRQKALALNLPIVAEYEDAGISGAFLRMREGMQSALADIEAGRADTLICANLSRYSRDVEHQQQIKKAVQNAGGRLVFSDMDFDDTPEGDLNFAIQGGFAEYERKVIRARTMRGKRKRAEEGQQPQRSRSPYGYHIVTKADILRGEFPAEMLGRYVVVEEKAAHVQRMFHAYASGESSLPKLARQLNIEGIPPPGSAAAWHEGTIRVLLRNPVYKGQPASGKQASRVDESLIGQPDILFGRPRLTGEVRQAVPQDQWIQLSAPALVSEEVWNAVQARFGVMRARYCHNPKRTRMLSGLAVCPLCGACAILHYKTTRGVPYFYFQCGQPKKEKRRGLPPTCTGDLYPLSIVEEAVLTAVREACQHPKSLQQAIAVFQRRQSSSISEPAALRRELTALDAALEQLNGEEFAAVQGQIAGIQAGASPHAYAEVFAALAARRKDLEDRRGILTQQLRPAKPKAEKKAGGEDAAGAAVAAARRVLTSPNVENTVKRQVLGAIVQRVVCRKDGARVVFLPGVFGEGAGQEEKQDTNYTTCMGIRTHR